MRYVFLILMLSLTTLYAKTDSNTDKIFWQDNFSDSKELAQKFGKPLFIFMESRRCYYCPIMKEQTFTDKRVIKAINQNFIPVILDNSTGSESDVENTGHAPERLTLSLTPAIYIMGPNEEKLSRKGTKHMIIYGMWLPDDLLIWIANANKKYLKMYGAKYAK